MPNEKSTCRLLVQLLDLALVEQRHHHPLGVVVVEDLDVLEADERAVAARRRRTTDRDVEVGGAGVDRRLEQGHEDRIWVEHQSFLPLMVAAVSLLTAWRRHWCVIASVVMGLVIGSFLTVVVDRVPRGASILAPPSACGACGHRLTAPDLVPIGSWLVAARQVPALRRQRSAPNRW